MIDFAVVARVTNDKTGDVPTLYVGFTREESKASCRGCPLLESECYAQHGTPLLGHASVQSTVARDGSRARYHWRRAINRRSKKARMFRVSALGDAARANQRELGLAMHYAHLSGLAVVGYTHFWREAPHLATSLCASVGSTTSVEKSIGEANEAIRAGFRPALVMPAGTTGTYQLADGHRAVLCPAIAAAQRGIRYTCNDCASSKRGALCEGSAGPERPVAYFPDHGPAARKARRSPALDARAA